MATIEELNFKLILDDAAFNAEVGKALANAKELNTNLSQILEIKQQISKISSADVANQRNANKILVDNAKTQAKIATDAERAAQARRLVTETTTSKVALENAKAREAEAQAVIKTQMAQERLNQLQMRGQQSLKTTSKLWQQVAAMAASYFSVIGATRLVRTLIDVSAEFELQKTTLGAILQSTEKAAEMYEKIKDLAVQSPFNFKELMTYAKQLTAFSVPVGELYDTTKMLADVSAGLGVGMDRLVLAYGQIRSASFLRGQEVRQLTEAGIPILEELRKQFVALGEEGITVGDVFDKISKRLVPFSMVEKVFMDMTSEGGKFYKMQEVQAETLKGKISNLTDAYQIMFSEIGEKHEGFLKGSVDAIRGIAENYERIGRVLVGLVATYGAYHAAILLERVARRAMFADYDNTLKYYQRFVRALKEMTKESKAYLAVQKALSKINWGALAVGAIVGVSVALANAAIQAEKFRKELDAIARNHADEAQKMVDDYHNLVGSLEGVTQGSQRYRDAIAELNRKYGEYLPHLLTEQDSLAELKRLEDELTNSIYARARAYAEAEGSKKINDRYGKRAEKRVDDLLGALDLAGVAEGTAVRFVQKFRDALKGSKKGDVQSIFEETFEKWVGADELKATKAATDIWDDLIVYAVSYSNALKKVNKETDKFESRIDAIYGASAPYGSAAEQEVLADVEEWYERRLKEERNVRRSQDETDKSLKQLYKDYLEMKKYAFENDEYEKGTPGIWKAQIDDINAALREFDSGDYSSFQRLLAPILSGDMFKDLMPQAGEDQVEYLDRLRKEYKNITDSIVDVDKIYKKLLSDKEKGLEVDEQQLTTQKQSLDRLQQRQAALNQVESTLGVSLRSTTGGRSGGSTAKSQDQKDLEERVDTLKELYSWYKKFRDLGLSDERTGTVLSKFFPDQKELLDGKKLENELLAAADALDKYDESAHKAAEAIRELVRGQGVSTEYEAIKNQIDAFDKYRQKVQDWLDKDYGLEGTDISFKASQILARLATQNAQTLTDAAELKKLYAEATKDEEVLKFIRETYGEEAWEKYLKEGEKVIDELVKGETEANRKIAQEKINDLADSYVKQKLFEKDLDLTDWGDKSYNQIKSITEQLKEMYKVPVEMSDETKKKAEELNVNLDELAENIRKIFGQKWQNATVEQMKKFVDVAKSVSSGVTDLGGLFTDLGDSIDSGAVSRMGELLEMAGGVADAILECKSLMEGLANMESIDLLGDIVDSADIVTMVIKIATMGLREVVDYVGQQYKTQLAINAAAIEYRNTLHEIALSEARTIFGTDAVKQAAEGFRYLTKAAEDFKKAQDDMRMGNPASMSFFNSLAALRGITTRDGGWAKARDEWNEMMGQTYEDSREYYEWLVANQDSIMENMTKKQKTAFQNLLKSLEGYKNAIEEVDSLMESVFGSLADSIADSLINAFIETGDAATDLANNMQGTFSDLGKDIAKSLISSFVISNILNKYKDTVESLFTYMSDTAANPDVIAQKFGELADNITQDADAAAQFTNALMTAMQNNGIDFDAESGTKAMSNGIKSITEDTANLLASYINAIRADVSVTRTMIATLLGLLPAAPTLSEYLAEIQANTFNTAQNTAEILAELRGSMAAFPNGGRAFNVNIS